MTIYPGPRQLRAVRSRGHRSRPAPRQGSSKPRPSAAGSAWGGSQQIVVPDCTPGYSQVPRSDRRPSV